MSKKVIYSNFNFNEHLYILNYLYRKQNWDPVFFIGAQNLQGWVEKKYPNAGFHSETAMRQSNFDYSNIGPLIPIDDKIIGALSKYESNYLSWLEDTTGWNFSFSERRSYYYDVLKFWNTVINNIKPDLFVGFTWPHTSDYPLYLLCKYYYSIPVLFFDPTPLLDKEFYSIGNSLENLSSSFEQIYLSKTSLETSEVVKKYLFSMRSSDAQIPQHVKDYYQVLDKSFNSRYMNFLRLIKMILLGRALRKSNMAFKKNKKPWYSQSSKLSHFDYYWFKKKLSRENKFLKIMYSQLAENPNLKKKYIYFPAPYQPEALSNLFAGVYEDIFLIIDMLSSSIPDDWLIYYKEHPNTFKPADKGALERSNYFYEKLDSYSKTRIVPFTLDTFKLIDYSQAVCTVGGTAGWEAVVRGKPALVYGSLWYQGCKSVFTIKTINDMFNSIKKIKEGFVPGEKDVERYAEAIYRSSKKRLIRPNGFRVKIKECTNPKYEMERIAVAYIQAYEKFYS